MTKNQMPPVTLENFVPLAKLVFGYEFKPGCAYLIVCDAKNYSPGLAEALTRDLRQMHPDINIAIIATPNAKGISAMEKKSDETETPIPGQAPETT